MGYAVRKERIVNVESCEPFAKILA